MSVSTATKWGYIVNASSGTGSVSVFRGPEAGNYTGPKIALIAVSMAGSATSDYAVLTDGDNNVVSQVVAQGPNFQAFGGIKMPGLTCQIFGGTNGTVSIYTV